MLPLAARHSPTLAAPASTLAWAVGGGMLGP